jgi:phosphohistidine phosphatase
MALYYRPERLLMKSLLLLRHAKSAKDNETLRDFDRPLNERGEDDARLIGGVLSKRRISPDAVISSPAKRARQTTELVLEATKLKTKARFDDRIYEADAHQLLRVISEIEPSARIAILIGHNPGFEDLLAALTGKYQRLPTASLARIDLPVTNWTNIGAGKGRLKWIVSPKDLKRESKDS